MWSGSEEGSYLRLMDCCIIHLWARKPSRRRERESHKVVEDVFAEVAVDAVVRHEGCHRVDLVVSLCQREFKLRWQNAGPLKPSRQVGCQ